jgi:hypothetical protein
MEHSLSYLLDLIGAFLLGMWVMEKVIFHKIRRALEEAGVDFEEESKVEVVKVKKYFIENINGLLYLYEHTTNNFIAQGNSLEELAILAKDKSEIAGVKYKEEVIWFVDGKVKTTI